MNTEGFIVHNKTEVVYKDIVNYVEKRFDILNYENECNSFEKPLPKSKNKK